MRLSQKCGTAFFYSVRGWGEISFTQFTKPLFYFRYILFLCIIVLALEAITDDQAYQILSFIS